MKLKFSNKVRRLLDMLIYKATNLINGKVYIGQTTKSLEERKAYHKRDAKRINTYFYRAINKYGWENFKWEILEDDISTREDLDDREKYYISLYDSFDNKEKGYNTQSGGCHFEVTEEEKRSRSERVKGEKNPMYGKPGTWLGKHFTEEHKKNLSKSLSGKKHPTTAGGNNPSARKVINLSTMEIFNCMKEACEKYDITANSLRNNIKGITKSCAGCKWEYYDENKEYKQNKDPLPIHQKKQIYVLELDQIFKTATAAAKAINCSSSLVSKVCKKAPLNEYGLAVGYHIKYV